MRFVARIFLGVLAFSLVPQPSSAAPTFDPSLILYDGDMQNHASMGTHDIQAFLDDRTGILKELRLTDRDGRERTAAEIIYRAAMAAKINPQILLVLLQKEQSLLEDGSPALKALDWALGYGVCDTCSMSDPRLRKFRGFATQLYGAATRLREYLDHPETFGWIRRGRPVVISGVRITPYTDATRALYLYTPHLSGARSFWNIWNHYFGQPYPDGTVLHERGTHNTWRIEAGSRRRFASQAVAVSMIDERFVLDVPHSVLANYPEGPPIKFANYSLVKTPRGAVYLLVNNTKRLIVSHAVFRSLGFNPEELIAVKDKDIKMYSNGAVITATSDTPHGTVLEDITSGMRYLVIANKRHVITSTAILNAVVSDATIARASHEDILRYRDGGALLFPSGTLLAGTDGTLAVISNGVRQEFASIEIARTLGYNPTNAIPVDRTIWELHPRGDTITIPPSDADPSAAARLAQNDVGR